MFTKTEAKVMKLFVSKITKRFSINQVAVLLKKPYPLIYKSIKSLAEQKLLVKDERGLISLNCKENHAKLAYIESLRSSEWLNANKNINLFFRECLRDIKNDFFILIVFGSSVERKGRDIDLLFIFGSEFEKNEKIAENLSKNYSINLDINAIAPESAYEMLLKREEANVMNELLNNHIILFGAENFYKIINNARK